MMVWGPLKKGIPHVCPDLFGRCVGADLFARVFTVVFVYPANTVI